MAELLPDVASIPLDGKVIDVVLRKTAVKRWWYELKRAPRVVQGSVWLAAFVG